MIILLSMRGSKAMANSAELKKKLSIVGGHFTAQRKTVYEYLSTASHHPTAEEVFLAVKKQLPRISLATVYKNLEALVACGAISKMNYGDGSARYDIRTDQHYHTRCLQCGKVLDLEVGESLEWLNKIQPTKGFMVKEYRLELLGYCQKCKR